ncbi:MAG: SUMF1/EgtB/PvdO family nonheme iron enzyme [Planctomycetes bacterium]|nr:SUMF1/EgtB/PvdO family nonheme iron enzyme [Planctomycetota bacterium]
MISVKDVARAAGVAMALLLVAGAAKADTHAPWPSDWNNWNDPALWVTVGNRGNGPDNTGYGAVAYTFNMGKFEVTAGQYTEFLNAVAKTDAYGLYDTNMWSDPFGFACKIQRNGSEGGYSYSVDAEWMNRPVNYVSWGDAARFANWLTNGQPTGAQNASTTEDGSYYLNGAISNAALLAVVRKSPEQGGRYYIPSEDEWYKAAYHKNDGDTGNYFNYPTGSDSVPSNDLTNPDGGNNANYHGNDGSYTIGKPYYRTPVGEFELSGSPYGTFDQGGNVLEWNEAILAGGYRGLRGGSFGSHSPVLHVTGRFDVYFPTIGTYTVGFRVSEVPEPASALLLGIGGAVVAMKRRRAC